MTRRRQTLKDDYMSTEQENLERLGALVIRARRTRYGSIEQAVRAAGVNRATWLRVEDGQAVRDASLSRIEAALGWPAGRAWRVLDGEAEDDPDTGTSSDEADPVRTAIVESSTLSDRDKEILLAQLVVMRARQEASSQKGLDKPSERMA